jgi:hypothetical protein
MSDVSNDPDLEARVRRAMRSLADVHQPSPSGQPQVQPGGAAPKRSWLVAAAALLVVGGVVAVFAVAGRDTSPSPIATDPPPVTTPNDTPNADGDVEIDPAAMRFAEPLPNGTAAFVNDTSLPTPIIGERGIVARGPAPSPDSVRVVVMDGPRLLMRGIITDVPAETDLDRPLGPAVSIGVDGATYLDADEGGIVIPIDGGRRIVGPDEIFTFGGGGPYIEPDALIEIASAVGQLPIDQVDQLPGFVVYQGTMGGETLDPLGVADATTVQHGVDGYAGVTLYRLADTPTAFELLAIGHALFRGELELLPVGGVALTAGGQSYLELLSPVDLVVLNASADLDERIEALDVAAAADLDEAFDGSVGAPPRPAP